MGNRYDEYDLIPGFEQKLDIKTAAHRAMRTGTLLYERMKS